MDYSWIQIAVAAIFISAVVTLVLSRGYGWLSPTFWRNAAVVSSLVMTFILFWLTFDTADQVRPGSGRIPDWTVINYDIRLVWDEEKRRQVPAVSQETGFFGKTWSREEAYELINKGKMTLQSRNCMECHQILGNGAYYAPDLTRAWLDPWWEERIMPLTGAKTREEAMMAWLKNPPAMPQGPRKMPNLKFDDDELVALIAFLKWMSAIDTNGFPPRFGVAQ